MCEKTFNEMEFIKREYELLRFLISSEGILLKKVNQTIETAIEEIINNEESLKYAICVKKDMFGIKQLNGVVTISFMLANLEKVKKEIADKLITTLLFEYQDEYKKIPFCLTGENFVYTKYINFLLANAEYKLSEQYGKRISELVIESIENEFDYWMLTTYFSRKDISIELKKFVIDSLDYDVLSRLVSEWEVLIMKTMIRDLNLDFLDLSDDDLDEFEREVESLHKVKIASLSEVIDLINEKLDL